MAQCSFYLRDTMLPNSASGGTWTKVGFSTTENGTYGAGGSTIPLGGDNPIIDPNDLVKGYYKLAYSDACNAPQEVILWIQDKSDAGTPQIIYSCAGDTTVINLYDGLIGEDSGGIWTVSPNSSPTPPSGAFNATNGTLSIPLLNQIGGEYKFVYTVTAQQDSDFEPIQCIDCSDFKEVTVSVAPIFKAGNNGTIVVSLTQGAFNLFDVLTGDKDTSGSWVQTAGSAVIIGGDYLGTINVDAVSGCTFEFKYSGGNGNCYDESYVVVNKNNNWNLNITASGNVLTASHSPCGFGAMTYQWYKDGVILSGATSQTLNTTGSAVYKVIICCNQCCQEKTYQHTQVCNNNPCFNFAYNTTTECLTLTNTGSTNSPIGSDILQWKKDGGSYANYTGAICGCNVREFLEVDTAGQCSIFSGMIRVGYTSSASSYCSGRSISRVDIRYGDGTTETHTGALGTDYVQWTPSQWIAKGNSATFKIRSVTPIGTIFKKIKWVYDGSGSLSCTNMSVTHINNPKLYYKIWGKRTVQYTDGCPTSTCESSWQLDNGCIVEPTLTLCNVSGVGSAVCVNVVNCSSTPTYVWKFNGSVLSGQTNSYCPTSYGNGIYTVEVTCGTCIVSDSITVQPPCTMEVAISVSGTVLTAVVTNCAGTKNYQWYKLVNGTWQTVGTNSASYTTTGNGWYKVQVTCVATGCFKEAEINFFQNCTSSVSISTVGNVLTANPSGCTGSSTYYWEYSINNGTSWTFVGTTQSITATVSALYRVTMTCDGCISTAQKYHQMPCTTGVSISVSGSGATVTLTANVTGCGANPITYLWERLSGGTWLFVGSTQSVTVTTVGTYRITATCNNCPAYAYYEHTGCNFTVNATLAGNQLSATQSGCPGAVTYEWQISTNGGATWSFYQSGNPATATQTGLYRVKGTCTTNNCIAYSGTVNYTNNCNNNVTLNYTAPTLTATITNCPTPQTIIWQFSPNYDPITQGCTGWTQIASGVTSIVPTQTGCYRVLTLCNGICPDEASMYIVISNPCDNVTMTVNPQIGKVSWGVLKKNGVTVTNYLISWRDATTNVELFKSGAGSYFNASTMYPHPSNNIPMPVGTYKPYILNSDFGNNLNCLPNFTVQAIQCGTIYQNNYSGAGGIAASQTVSVAVSNSTGFIKIGFRTFTVPDKVQVKYNGSIIFDSGNISTGFNWVEYVVPITYVSGQNYADVIITNSNPTQSTIWNILINCCNPKTPCGSVVLNLATTTAALDANCGCGFDFVGTWNGWGDMFNNLCLNVSEYGVNPQSAVIGGCSIGYVSQDFTCVDCADITTTKTSGSNGVVIVFPASCNSKYLSVKARIQATTNPKHFVGLTLKKVPCTSDGTTASLYIFPSYGTVVFNDAARTITYTMAASNPYANSCTNCDVILFNFWNNTNSDYSNAANPIFGIWKSIIQERTHNAIQVNVSDIVFEEKIVSECGTITRKYKISYRNANCPCQSWELYEDVDNNGTYETLRQQASGWTGSCI